MKTKMTKYEELKQEEYRIKLKLKESSATLSQRTTALFSFSTITSEIYSSFGNLGGSSNSWLGKLAKGALSLGLSKLLQRISK